MIRLIDLLSEDLRAWFGKGKKGGAGGGGWDRYNSSGDRIGKCGDAKEGEAYAACLSKEKAHKLGKAGRAAFVKRKRAAQKKGGDAKKGGESSKGQKPIKVKTGANEEMTPRESEKIGMPFKGKHSRELKEKWSKKYKTSIDCSHPKGFSQKAHCQGRKKKIKEIDYHSKISRGHKPDWFQLNTSEFKPFDKSRDDVKTENFADGKNPGRKGLSKRFGISQKMSIAQLEKIAKSATGERRRMAQWNLNMKRGRKKENLDPSTFKDTGKSAPYGSGYQELEERLNLFLEKNVPTNPEKWAYYKSQAKKKFDVYPSAYANGWAAKMYKKAGGGWRKG